MTESEQRSASPGSPSIMGRRQLLTATGAVIAVGVTSVATAGDAGASSRVGRTRTVWKLDPDWGYPRGPHDKTRLNSRASRSAARHRYALTRSDAEQMNLHLCSFAPPVRVLVDADAFDELWDGLSYEWTSTWSGETVRLLDDRHAGRLTGGGETLRIALGGRDQASEPPRSAAPVPARGGTASAAASQDPGRATMAGTSPGSSTAGPSQLAMTGAGLRSVFVAGAAALSAGAVMLRSRRGPRARASDVERGQSI